MIPVPSGVRVWLAAGATDMMGWTPLATGARLGVSIKWRGT
jgi:hypothetical protein